MLTDIQRRARLILQGRMNNTDIAQLTKCARNTVILWRKRLQEVGTSLDDIANLDDTEIRKIVAPGAFARKREFDKPDMDQVLFELVERSVTAKTLYQEYVERVPQSNRAMSLTSFYRLIEQHSDKKNITVSFEYKPGEMVQVDFAGRKKAKQPLLLDEVGDECTYEVFCAVSAKSRYTFVMAIESQSKLQVMAAFVSMLEFFGGVPVLITIDNFKAAVKKPRRGKDEPELTPEFQELADHYQFGLKPARILKPKDKALIENGVGIIQNDVLAPLRNRRFFSLSELNSAIREHVEALNNRTFSKQTGESRRQLFSRIDSHGFCTLPEKHFEPGQWILKLRVGRDYHVPVAGNRYSVPSRLANQLVNAKLTVTSVHLSHNGRIVATHLRSEEEGKQVTNLDHMPRNHQQALMMRLSGMKAHVREIGPNAESFIEHHFRKNKNPRSTAKTAIRLRTLIDQYSEERLDAACGRAVTVGKCSIRKVQSILAIGVDRLEPKKMEHSELPDPKSNVRGATYFQQLLTGKEENGDV